MRQVDSSTWAEQTFARCDLGDKRRTQRTVDIAQRLDQHGGGNLLQACDGDDAAKTGGYRFIRNDQAKPQAIREGAFQAVAQQVRDQPDQPLLINVQDTTTLSYSHMAAESLGDLGGKADAAQRGFWVHSSLLLRTDRRVVGLIDQDYWQRDSKARGQSKQRKQRPYAEKESHKWQAAHQRTVERLGPDMERCITVCDREADIYEFLAYMVQTQSRFVVRQCQDRRVQDEMDRTFESLARQPEMGTYTVTVAQRGGQYGRSKREVKLSLRAMAVTLQPPAGKSSSGLEPLTLSAVLAQEIDPPDPDNALCWRLWTTEPISCAAQVRQVVAYYESRWTIEEFHKAWKTGGKVEEQQLQSAGALERMASLLAFVAVRLLQLRSCAQSDALADRACSEALDRDQWQCLWLSVEKKPLPKAVPDCRWACQTLGRLGGWTDSKRTGRVGWLALWRGWRRLEDRLEGYRLAKEHPPG